MRWVVRSTPVGELSLATDGAAICRVGFGRYEGPLDDSGDALLESAAEQLDEYFAGERTAFDLPLADVGGSEFDRAVWAALGTIPYGEMRTYGQIAAAVGDPTAARAVGVACNRNRLAIVLPCHRVVGADGKLVGFGGGLPNKRFLLELEARVRIEHDFAF
jgi:methylated-DNA-[protein]-cysteine S-methyltransferase